MREISKGGGIIRWPLIEALPPPFNGLPDSRFTIHAGFRYFTPGPTSGPPWLEFPDAPPVPGQMLPPGFVAIFGQQPVDDALHALDRGFWEQQLGLWRDDKKPDWLDDVTEAFAKMLFDHYGLGTRLLYYRLNNGAERVAFPDADARIMREQLPRMFWEDCYIAFKLTLQAIATYQLARMALGVVIPDSLKSPFILRLGEQTQHHG